LTSRFLSDFLPDGGPLTLFDVLTTLRRATGCFCVGEGGFEDAPLLSTAGNPFFPCFFFAELFFCVETERDLATGIGRFAGAFNSGRLTAGRELFPGRLSACTERAELPHIPKKTNSPQNHGKQNSQDVDVDAAHEH
jgi:hypothetical protein